MQQPEDRTAEPIPWGEPATWGELLQAKVRRHGGLKFHVDRIQAEAGWLPVGSRNTFAKLFDYDEPPDDPTDRGRAWALLLSLGANPDLWGVGDVAVPPALNVSQLRSDFGGAGRDECRDSDLGKPDSGWSTVLAGQLASAA